MKLLAHRNRRSILLLKATVILILSEDMQLLEPADLLSHLVLLHLHSCRLNMLDRLSIRDLLLYLRMFRLLLSPLMVTLSLLYRLMAIVLPRFIPLFTILRLPGGFHLQEPFVLFNDRQGLFEDLAPDFDETNPTSKTLFSSIYSYSSAAI